MSEWVGDARDEGCGCGTADTWGKEEFTTSPVREDTKGKGKKKMIVKIYYLPLQLQHKLHTLYMRQMCLL